MRAFRFDADTYKSVLHRRLLRAAASAIARLDQAARGRDDFDNDYQFRAAVALSRLGPALVGVVDEEQASVLDGPEYTTAKKIELLEILRASREDCDVASWVHLWHRCFVDHGPQEGRFQTAEEAMEYGRQRGLALEAKRLQKSELSGNNEVHILNEGDLS